MPRKALLNGALTLGVSKGVVIRHSDHLAAPCRTLARLVGMGAKREIGSVLAPYHASRECRVR